MNSPTSLRTWRLTAIIICTVAVFYVSTVQLNGSDFWLQAKIGEIIVQSHHIPDTVLFPFTEIASEKFNAHEWLASILFHYLLQGLGESGMPLFIGLLGLIFFAQMCYLAYLRGRYSLPLALVCGLVAVAVENYRHVLRPELISLIWMGFFWIFLEKFRLKPRLVSGALIAMFLVLWVNSHGSFVLGPILIFIYAGGSFIDEVKAGALRDGTRLGLSLRLFFLALMSCACCLINPFGAELVRFAVGFGGSNELHALPGEWMPTFDRRVFTLRGFWIGFVAWILILVAILTRKKKFDSIDILVFVAFSFLAYKAIRFPVYLGIVAAFVIPASVPFSWTKGASQVILLQLSCFLAGVGLIAAMVYGNASGSSPYVDATRTRFSEPMAQLISSPSLKGHVLNSMELGPELIYLAYPRLHPSSDVRLDSYGLDYLKFQEALFYNNDLLVEFVQRYDVRYVLVNSRTFIEFQKLASWKSKKWRILLVDSRAALLQRSDLVE